ncbi:MAG: flagellar biosynthetic protein FliR [Parachlamydiales bacterium]|jgi:type III secretion protein SpaR/YscT/HrcT
MTENYILELFNKAFANYDPLAPLTLMFLFLARMLPIIALAPFLGARVAPHPVKMALGIALFVLFAPLLVTETTIHLTFSSYTVLLIIKEFFIGLILGFIISLPFVIVQNAGIIIDHQRGGASLMVNDPTVQNQSSPLGTLFNMVMIYIFYVGIKGVDGVSIFFNAILHSYEVIPPDQFFSDYFFQKGTPFWKVLMELFNKIMVLSIEMATPGLLIILMTDFFLGIINRLAPQVQITFLGMPLKSLLALAIITLGWHVYTDQFAKDSIKWTEYLYTIINMFDVGKAPIAP